MIREDAALAFLDSMKSEARAVHPQKITYRLTGNRKLGVSWHPDVNYGRLHEPPESMDAWAYRWSYYKPAFYAQDTHVEAPERGWRGLQTGPLGEREALTLLMGRELPDAPSEDEYDALFAEIAERSGQVAAFAGGPLAQSVFRFKGGDL